MQKLLTFLLPIIAAVLVVTGCAAQKAVVVQDKTVETTLDVSRAQYLKGIAALKNADFDGAFQAFRNAAKGPSYIEYSRLARLRLADTLYYQDMYDEAAEAYRGFINISARNANLHYAYFRLADSKVKAISGDFFLVPPSDRRDQKKVRSALKAIDTFVALYPDSPFCSQVIALKNKMVATVSSFELEVAHFYMTRKKPVGAVSRLKRLMSEVPPVRDSEAVRALYVKALAAAGDNEQLSRECIDYLERFPTGKHRSAVTSQCSKVKPEDVKKSDELSVVVN